MTMYKILALSCFAATTLRNGSIAAFPLSLTSAKPNERCAATIAMLSNYDNDYNERDGNRGRRLSLGPYQTNEWETNQRNVDDNYDTYSYDAQPPFGSGEYYPRRGGNGDFRRPSSGDRSMRRDDLRYDDDFRGPSSGNRSIKRENLRYPSRNGVSGYGGMGGRRQSSYGGWPDQSEDFRRGRGSSSRNSAGGRIQDYSTPGEREAWQQQQNRGVGYGWQQQYDVERGNVRRGSSSDFRRGNAFDRVQDFFTPGQRERQQQLQNQGARYGWQQQYNTDRGNVRGGSSSDFRRGSAFDSNQDFSTPLERERRQMQDNRALGRGQMYASYDRRGRGDVRELYGRDDGNFDGRQDDYYEPEIVGSSRRSNRNIQY